MAPNKAIEREREIAEVKQGLDLIVSPLVQTDAQKVAAKPKQRAAQRMAAKA